MEREQRRFPEPRRELVYYESRRDVDEAWFGCVVTIASSARIRGIIGKCGRSSMLATVDFSSGAFLLWKLDLFYRITPRFALLNDLPSFS